MDKNYLYGWVFHFNSFTDKWQAAKRENAGLLFSDNKSSKVLRSSDINTLIYIIKKTNGDEKKIDKLCNQQ